MSLRFCAWCLVACLAMTSGAASAEELAEKLRLVRPELAESPFGRPLLLESSEEGGDVRGNVVALVDHPIAALRSSLDTPAEWCEVLILHLNVKSCLPGEGAASDSLALLLGRKGSEDGDGSHTIDFVFRVPESSAERFRVAMEAASGPLGTTAYRLSLDAIPVGRRSSFIRLTYAYAYGTAARIAISSYLGTLGKDKIGFSTTAGRRGGNPVYVGGLRGVLERNTMRYFLGIETFLDSAAQPAVSRTGWRLRTWFDATERYPRQLHELTKAEYLAGKQGRSSSSVTDPVRTFARSRPD
jgi:hypothetical protein